MKLSNNRRGTDPAAHNGQSKEQTLSILERENITAQPASPAKLSRPGVKHRLILRILSILLLITLIFALVRLSTVLSTSNDQLLVRLGNQGAAIVDLRQSLPISPSLFGANVFPEASTSSVDRAYTGFMSYSPPIANGLQNAQIQLLRFPGGSWGEEHLLSYDQLNAFSTLLSQVGAEGMIQASLSGPVGHSGNSVASLANRANLAGNWVDSINNPHTTFPTSNYPHPPFHPTHFS